MARTLSTRFLVALGALGGLTGACSDRDPNGEQEVPVDPGLGGAGGAGGGDGSGGVVVDAKPLYGEDADFVPEELGLRFVEVEVSQAGGGTDIEFFRDRPEFLMTLRSGGLLHGALKDGEATTLRTWSFNEELITDGACGPTNILLDPEFETNDFFYVTYCVDDSVTRLVRYTFSRAFGPVEPAVIFETEVDPLDYWHRFGSMGFEEDGVLWFFLGDHFHMEEAQDPETPFGGLHRIIPSREPDGSGYEPAPSNMEKGQGDEVEPFPSLFAYGLRSPWRGTRDKRGRYWVGDVGHEGYEEVNLITKVGQNLGWATHEGPCEDNCEGITDPVAFYDRSNENEYTADDPLTVAGSRRAIWVGQIYESPTVDRYHGLMDDVVIFGDLFTGWVRALRANKDGEITMNQHVGHLESVTQWKVGQDGYAYAVDLSGHLHVALLAEAE